MLLVSHFYLHFWLPKSIHFTRTMRKQGILTLFAAPSKLNDYKNSLSPESAEQFVKHMSQVLQNAGDDQELMIEQVNQELIEQVDSQIEKVKSQLLDSECHKMAISALVPSELEKNNLEKNLSMNFDPDSERARNFFPLSFNRC